MTYIADYHSHTNFSHDAKYDMEEMVKKAIDIGLNEIAFTEHVDYEIPFNECDYDAYFDSVKKLQNKYNDKIIIRSAMEFGMQKHTINKYYEDLKKYSFDFILLSVHQIDNKEFWDNSYQIGRNQRQIHEDYYNYLYNIMSNFKDYSVLAHLDVIKRYDPYGDYDDEKVMPIIDKILKLAINDGKGIELNTSSFKYGLKDLTPSRTILKRYLELGGKIITIGSDSHDPSRVGDRIVELKEELKAIGFKEFCTFDKMKPIFHKL